MICRCLTSLFLLVFFAMAQLIAARPITVDGQAAVLNIRAAGAGSLRITLKPESFKPEFPATPVLLERDYPRPALSLREINKPVKAKVAGLFIEVQPNPLRVVVSGKDGTVIQTLTFPENGSVTFALDDQPVLGMGEGGPATPLGVEWRAASVEFDRRGHLDKMEPRWQREAYGSRNPVALMAGTRGWGLFFAAPWGQLDQTQTTVGYFIPTKYADGKNLKQTFKNQGLQLGKGIPPPESLVPGLLDIFVFDARRPEVFVKDLVDIVGHAVMPPKWALGYMQSHCTLEDDGQMIKEVDTFRAKGIPIDAVIYLGTGFTPRGWNTLQPSFQFNPEVFKRDPSAVFADLHERHVKVALHVVPWDRDRLPSLQGSIPPKKAETVDTSHITEPQQHAVAVIRSGVERSAQFREEQVAFQFDESLMVFHD